MDEGKILVVNLSKGLIGEDNASILGAFLVTKVQLAAMSRSDIPNVEDRRPFYLYVDEFQNFATDSFAVILSEARKYGLNLTVANQYISQMTDPVRDAVFGNVGTTISFRVSADDAPDLVKQFEPIFEAGDLLNMHNRHFVISMIISGEKAPPFSATTLNIPESPSDFTDKIIEHSRMSFARPRAEIEKEIRENIEAAEKYKKELSDSGRQGAENDEPMYFSPSNPRLKYTDKYIPSGVSDKNRTENKSPRQNNYRSKQKPRTPQEALRSQKLSPNQAEQKSRPTLKDLGKLATENNPPKDSK